MQQITDKNYTQELLEASGSFAVCFTGERCPHCRAYEPTFRRAAEHSGSNWQFRTVNVDISPRTASHFGITSIPTTVLLRGGEVVNSTPGNLSGLELERLLHSLDSWDR